MYLASVSTGQMTIYLVISLAVFVIKNSTGLTNNICAMVVIDVDVCGSRVIDENVWLGGAYLQYSGYCFGGMVVFGVCGLRAIDENVWLGGENIQDSG